MDTVAVLINDSYLGKSEQCRCAVRGRPTDPNQPECTLALIERQGAFAVFLFSNIRHCVVEATDLKLDNVVPVAEDFLVEEINFTDSLVDEMQIQVSNERVSLDFLLPPGLQSKDFVRDVKRASDGARKTVVSGNPRWNWLEKHINRIENRTGLSVHRMSHLHNGDLDSDDVSVDTFMSTTSCASTLTPDEADRLSLGSSCRGSPFPEESLGSSHNSPARKFDLSDHGLNGGVNGDSAGFEIHSEVDGDGPDLVDAPLGCGFADNIIRRPGKMARTNQRETFVNMNMLMREQDFTELQKFSVFTGTWNVNGQYPSESLEAWLGSDSTPPDLYAIGFQELDISKEAFLGMESPREHEWHSQVAKPPDEEMPPIAILAAPSVKHNILGQDPDPPADELPSPDSDRDSCQCL